MISIPAITIPAIAEGTNKAVLAVDFGILVVSFDGSIGVEVCESVAFIITVGLFSTSLNSF